MTDSNKHNTKTRKPAAAPNKTKRERFLHRLPRFKGPYTVGYMDIEVPVRNPRPVSNLKRNGKPVLRLDTVLMGIYYPGDVCKQAMEQGGLEKLHRVDWMPRPRIASAKGYAKFLNVPEMPVTAYMAVTTLFTKLPAFRNAKLATPFQDAEKEETGHTDDAFEKPKFPVIMFSHGLGGSRLCYSTICGELASFGFIVVAVEHRDGSGARTLVSLPRDVDASAIESSTAKLYTNDEGDEDVGSKKVKDKRKEGCNPYYVVDYISPKDNAQDTSPHNAHGVDLVLRSAQIELRHEEIKEAFYIVDLINQGRGEEVAAHNLRRKGNVGSSSLGLTGVQWDQWKGSMHMNKVTAMGHSFGGATTVHLCRDDSLTWLGQGVSLDTWGQALPPGGDTVCDSVTKPIIAISSEAFMHWPENYQSVVSFCQEAREHNMPCWMVTLAGTTHLAMTDFAVLYPHWMSIFMKSMLDPLRGLYLTTCTSLEFLKEVLPQEQTKCVRWCDGGWLLTDEAISDPDEAMRTDHAPDNKWIAVRLKMHHEFSTRAKHVWNRFTRAVLCSVKELDVEARGGGWDEIWTHFSPEPEQLVRYRERVSNIDKAGEKTQG